MCCAAGHMHEGGLLSIPAGNALAVAICHVAVLQLRQVLLVHACRRTGAARSGSSTLWPTSATGGDVLLLRTQLLPVVLHIITARCALASKRSACCSGPR